MSWRMSCRGFAHCVMHMESGRIPEKQTKKQDGKSHCLELSDMMINTKLQEVRELVRSWGWFCRHHLKNTVAFSPLTNLAFLLDSIVFVIFWSHGMNQMVRPLAPGSEIHNTELRNHKIKQTLQNVSLELTRNTTFLPERAILYM